jgi:hypothetical protein
MKTRKGLPADANSQIENLWINAALRALSSSISETTDDDDNPDADDAVELACDVADGVLEEWDERFHEPSWLEEDDEEEEERPPARPPSRRRS